MNLRKKIANKDLYTEYVKILNGVLQLSNRVSEVFAFILAADFLFPSNINSKVIRKAITQKLNIPESNLSKYLRVLKDKNLIVRSSKNKWIVNDNIRPIIIENKEDLSKIVEVSITLNVVEANKPDIVEMDNKYSKVEDETTG